MRGLAIIRNEVIKRLSTRTQSLAPRTGCVAWSIMERGLVPPIRFSGVRLHSSSAGGDPLKNPLKDPSILAAIEKERTAMLAAKPEKLGRSLLGTLKAHRDELFNMLLAALLLVLTLKMLREKVKMIVRTKACDLIYLYAHFECCLGLLQLMCVYSGLQGEKLDEESDSDKRIKVLEAELASIESSIAESVRTVCTFIPLPCVASCVAIFADCQCRPRRAWCPSLRLRLIIAWWNAQGLPVVSLGWGGSRSHVQEQVLLLVRDGIANAKDRQGNFEKTRNTAAATAAAATAAAATPPASAPVTTPQAASAAPTTQAVVKKSMV